MNYTFTKNEKKKKKKFSWGFPLLSKWICLWQSQTIHQSSHSYEPFSTSCVKVALPTTGLKGSGIAVWEWPWLWLPFSVLFLASLPLIKPFGITWTMPLSCCRNHPGGAVEGAQWMEWTWVGCSRKGLMNRPHEDNDTTCRRISPYLLGCLKQDADSVTETSSTHREDFSLVITAGLFYS